MNHLEADATCFANLKGSKEKDLLGTARALLFKKQSPGFGSNTNVGRYYGVSRETVREFLALLTLPDQIQSLIDDGKIGLDTGARLARAGRLYPEKLIDLGTIVAGMPALDARDLIEYSLKNPELSADQAKQLVLDSKTVFIDEFHVVAVFSMDEFTLLENEAKKRQMATGKLVEVITKTWLERKRDDAS